MMRFLPSLLPLPTAQRGPAPGVVLQGKRILLRMGDALDWRPWRALREMSRDFLVPWEPSWAQDGLTHHFFSGMLRRHWRDWCNGKAYSFFIYLRSEANPAGGMVIGGITLSDVTRGISQKGTLGYWVGQPYAGQGYMKEAAGLICDFAFEQLQLHRIEASCLPHNTPSKQLLTRLGFMQEGYARSYLKINGQWQDHLLWGKISPGENADKK